MKKIQSFIIFVLTGLMCSCLENDIPYPHIQAVFLSMSADGVIGTPVIDAKSQTVSFRLAEQTDIRNVEITDYEITEGAAISEDITGGIDLSREKRVILSLYQDYDWTLKATQEIERYFSIDGQIGASVIDFPAKRVVCYAPKKADLTQVRVTSLKLGPADITTYGRNLTRDVIDGSAPVILPLSYHDINETWTIYIQRSDVDVALTQVDAWTRVIWAYCEAEAGKDNGVEYRKQGEEEWTRVPEENLTVNGGRIKACINKVLPLTSYEVRAFSGDIVSATQTVTTTTEQSIPNMELDDWWLDGKMWCPWQEGDDTFWGTGNKGATTLGDSNSQPSTDTWNGKPGYSAELNTRFIGIGVVGKLAAGNLFTGVYKRTDGTNGVLDFGRPYSGRPTRMRGWWKHKAANISHSNDELAYLKGRPDTAAIYVALTDWEEPYEIRTRPTELQVFNVNDPHIIAYGTVETWTDITAWTEFVIELQYRDTKRVPRYILIVCSASKLGDYFTGGEGGTLWVDHMSFDWNY